MKEAEQIEGQLRAKMGGAPAAPGFPAAAPQGYPAAGGYYAGGYWDIQHPGSDAQVKLLDSW